MVEPASIDEGYLDVTDVCKDKDPIILAREMQTHILQNIGLPCSIGIGPNKLLAKMASDMKKPLGITVLRKREVSTKMWPLKVEELQGVGKKTVKLLNELKIYTIGDLANYDDIYTLRAILGKNYIF
jgi:DNA polymerase-4